MDEEALLTTPEDIKTSVAESYDAQPHKGSKTPLILGAVAVVLIILFIIVIIVFFNIGNAPPTHEIAIVNNTSQNITVYVKPTDTITQFSSTVTPRQIVYFRATPGVNLTVKASFSDFLNFPYTTVELQLAGQNYNGPGQLYQNGNIINTAVNDNPTDLYGVSLQQGHNINATIASTNFNNRDAQDAFSCGGPQWITPFTCPNDLSGTGGACLSPCTAFGGTAYCCTDFDCEGTTTCQSQWPSINYYSNAVAACPTCLITNCQGLNYHCSSVGGLTQYTISFT